MRLNKDLVVVVAMLAVLVLMLLPLFRYNPSWLRYAFAASALVVFAFQLWIAGDASSSDDDIRVRRLRRMNAVSGLLYCVAAACLFIEHPTAKQSWVPCVLAGAVMQLYATLMMPKKQK